jgi:hypothetical protein
MFRIHQIDRSSDIFHFTLHGEMRNEPIADQCGHLAKLLPPSELVIGAWQELQPLWSPQRVTQSPALMEGDTFILLTLDY